MAAYMKTEMPFYGIQKPDRRPVIREAIRQFPPVDAANYKKNVLSLWAGEHREEKYAALDYADRFRKFHIPKMMPLFERLIREGAWWDLVDPVATHMVSDALLHDRDAVRPRLEKWLTGKNMWLRRSTIISQMRLKDQTDHKALFADCLACIDETEFFIRKAIGWALREYSYVDSERVKDFLTRHRERLSGLSYREGAKALIRDGHMTKE